MALKFYESPFHVTHSEEVASKMAMKMDLSLMIAGLIKEKGWTQKEAAGKLGINQSRVSELINARIELFTVDAMLDVLDILGFKARVTVPQDSQFSVVLTKTKRSS